MEAGRVLRLAIALALVAAAARAQPVAGISIDPWDYRLQPSVDGACEEYLAELDARWSCMVVLDPACGVTPRDFSAAEITPLRTRPDGTRRMVLAYLSVGEAEDYRFYWRDSYRPAEGPTPGNPSWLGPVNPAWPDNYLVRYWEPGWRRILVDGPFIGPNGTRIPSSLDRILAAGFDGVYVDLVDNYEHWMHDRPSAREEMVALVEAIKAYGMANSRVPAELVNGHPRFVVVAQNGLDHFVGPDLGARYKAAVSGVAVEAMYFDAHDQPTDPATTAGMEARLTQLKQQGFLVMTVDYALQEANRVSAATRSRALGFAPFVGHVDLKEVVIQPGEDPPEPTPSPTPSPTPTPDPTTVVVDPDDDIEMDTSDRPDVAEGDDPEGDGDEAEDQDDDTDGDGDDDRGDRDRGDRPGWGHGDRNHDHRHRHEDEPRGEIRRVVTGAALGVVLGIALGPVGALVGGIAGGAVGKLWHEKKADDERPDQEERIRRYIEAPSVGRPPPGGFPARILDPTGLPEVDREEFLEARRALLEALRDGDAEARAAAWQDFHDAWSDRIESIRRSR